MIFNIHAVYFKNYIDLLLKGVKKEELLGNVSFFIVKNKNYIELALSHSSTSLLSQSGDQNESEDNDVKYGEELKKEDENNMEFDTYSENFNMANPNFGETFVT
jgi:lipopolysaccharide export LptBFGC system permease protein LptF